MNIALCTDENYSFPCGVCITSILENNKDEELNIYILTNGLKPRTIRKLEQLEAKYKQKIKIKSISDNLFNGLKVNNRFPKSIYYRLLLPQLLNDKKVIYLDCDIVVTASLKDLWNTDLTNCACGVIEDQRSDDITIQNRTGLYRDYFNSGVLVMNLEYWREHRTTHKLTDYIDKNSHKSIYPDQDALNAVIGDEVTFLEYTYNYQQLFFQPKEEILLHKSKWQKLELDGKLPTIIHYTHDIKPWHRLCGHPLRDQFLKYKALSPWKREWAKSRFSIVQKVKLILQNSLYLLRT